MSRETKRAQPDFTKEFILTTDASENAIGGILSQRISDNNEVMIYAFSKTMDKNQPIFQLQIKNY